MTAAKVNIDLRLVWKDEGSFVELQTHNNWLKVQFFIFFSNLSICCNSHTSSLHPIHKLFLELFYIYCSRSSEIWGF